MKQLPEAARVIVERARDAHDPSEAQLQNMLANLHARLGYARAPSEPATVPEAAPAAVGRARGLLHAKLLKLVLSLAAIGGMAALIAPRLSTPEPAQPPAAALVPAAAEHEHENPPAPREPAAEPPQTAPAAHAKAEPTGRRVQRARIAQEKTERRAPAPPTASGAIEPEPSVPTEPTTAVVAAPTPSTEKVLLSADVVPLQAARKRVAERASGPSDADELRLIDRAASLLRDGEPEQALELLQEHGRKFPASQLQLERRGLSVLARCGAGQIEQGRRERDAFLHDAARAPIAARVRKACPERQP